MRFSYCMGQRFFMYAQISFVTFSNKRIRCHCEHHIIVRITISPPFVCNRSLDSIVNFPYTYCKISLHFHNYLNLATFSKPML